MTLETEVQLQVLKDFANAEIKTWEVRLEEILDDVGKTGQYIFPWHFMKPLYAYKLDKVTSEFLEAAPPLNTDGTPDLQQVDQLKEFRAELMKTFDQFSCAPFTLQRVTELLRDPKRHYRKTAKFYRGLEKYEEFNFGKNIMVISTLEMASVEQRNLLKRQRKTSSQVIGNGVELKPPIKRYAADNVSQNWTETWNYISENAATPLTEKTEQQNMSEMVDERSNVAVLPTGDDRPIRESTDVVNSFDSNQTKEPQTDYTLSPIVSYNDKKEEVDTVTNNKEHTGDELPEDLPQQNQIEQKEKKIVASSNETNVQVGEEKPVELCNAQNKEKES